MAANHFPRRSFCGWLGIVETNRRSPPIDLIYYINILKTNRVQQWATLICYVSSIKELTSDLLVVYAPQNMIHTMRNFQFEPCILSASWATRSCKSLHVFFNAWFDRVCFFEGWNLPIFIIPVISICFSTCIEFDLNFIIHFQANQFNFPDTF